MTLIDGDKIITAQLHDDEHEEFTEQKMSIIDFVNAYSDEGVTTADDVLDKIRAEMMQLDYDLESVDYDYNDMAMTEEVHMICREEVLRILDKYKVEVKPQESEVQDADSD